MDPSRRGSEARPDRGVRVVALMSTGGDSGAECRAVTGAARPLLPGPLGYVEQSSDAPTSTTARGVVLGLQLAPSPAARGAAAQESQSCRGCRAPRLVGQARPGGVYWRA